jgi:hypothetical protein
LTSFRGYTPFGTNVLILRLLGQQAVRALTVACSLAACVASIGASQSSSVVRSTPGSNSALIPLQVGGSNYVAYDVGKYLTTPTQQIWFTPGTIRPVIGTFHLDSMKVKHQLTTMYANGQRRLALVLWYGDFSNDARIRDSLVYGHVVNSELGHLMPRHVANLVRLLQLIRDAGYREIVFRFATQGASSPKDWATWDSLRYNSNWNFTFTTRDLIEDALAHSRVRVTYDLDLEAAGVERGFARSYNARLWQAYAAKYGIDRTVGFSVSPLSGRLTNALADYDQAGRRPPEYAFDIYGNELQTLTYLRKELLAGGESEAQKPIIVLEDFYNDTLSASAIAQSRIQLRLNIRTIFQWPLARGAKQPHFSMHYAPDYSNYLAVESNDRAPH